MAAVTKDEGVVTIYPRIREFELLCRRANLPFATDHIRGAETCLSESVVEAAYGKDFVRRHPDLFNAAAAAATTATASSSQWVAV